MFRIRTVVLGIATAAIGLVLLSAYLEDQKPVPSQATDVAERYFSAVQMQYWERAAGDLADDVFNSDQRRQWRETLQKNRYERLGRLEGFKLESATFDGRPKPDGTRIVRLAYEAQYEKYSAREILRVRLRLSNAPAQLIDHSIQSDGIPDPNYGPLSASEKALLQKILYGLTFLVLFAIVAKVSSTAPNRGTATVPSTQRETLAFRLWLPVWRTGCYGLICMGALATLVGVGFLGLELLRPLINWESVAMYALFPSLGMVFCTIGKKGLALKSRADVERIL
jgi:hypothetical protein